MSFEHAIRTFCWATAAGVGTYTESGTVLPHYLAIVAGVVVGTAFPLNWRARG